ncbi:MAG: GPW/gp25 family protein [Holosporales bacterium]|jgi:predicted component of type VI protein secretion system|nr:GPW/gp25 family protein [Holosporales bacterium]
MTRVDREYLAKFQDHPVYLESERDISDSITKEIRNILSTKLGWSHPFMSINFRDLPVSYGVRDLSSIGTSQAELENFKVHCRAAILNFEPRLCDLEISGIRINKEIQSISIEMICHTRLKGIPPFVEQFILTQYGNRPSIY